jgi:hypothetical protein
MAAFGKYDAISVRKDKRQTKRRTIGATAYIRLGAFATRPCTVLDLSDTGVRISIESVTKIPARFTLLISKNTQSRSACVKWRRGNQIGAEFI